MKQCPSCKTQYTDDSLRFCLQDGTPLTDPSPPSWPGIADEEETVQASRTRFVSGSQSAAGPPQYVETPRRSRTGAIVAFTGVTTIVLLAIGGAAAWFFINHDKTANIRANTENQDPRIAVSNVATPTPTATATPTPTNSNSNAAPKVDKAAVSREVSDAVSAWKRDTESLDIERLMQNYADRVDYYRTAGARRDLIKRDKERAFGTFDSISLSISNLKVSPDDSGQNATAEFDKAWEFEGDHVSEGKVRSQLRLKKVNGKWLITAEKDLKVY